MSAQNKKKAEVPDQPWDITQPTGCGITERVAAFGRMAKGPSMDATELTRLLSVSKGGELKNVSDEEIDTLIDLAARCQWRLELAKEVWELRMVKLWREEVARLPEPSERVVRILAMKGSTIPFEKGLILLGVPAKGDRKKTPGERRKTHFFPFYKKFFIENNYCEFFYLSPEGRTRRAGGARDPQNWIEPSETDIRSAYKKQQEVGWTVSRLVLVSGKYDKYKSEDSLQQKSDAGTKSAIARKAKKKQGRRKNKGA